MVRLGDDKASLKTAWTPTVNNGEAVTNLCHPLKRTRLLPLSLSRHSRAGISYAAASRLGLHVIPALVSTTNSVRASWFETRGTWPIRYCDSFRSWLFPSHAHVLETHCPQAG